MNHQNPNGRGSYASSSNYHDNEFGQNGNWNGNSNIRNDPACGNSRALTETGGGGSNSFVPLPLAGEPQARNNNTANAGANRNLHQLNGSKFQSTSNNGNGGIISLPFKQWIKHSLNRIGDNNGIRAAASSAYLESAIKVAISLTEQIIQAEKLGGCGISKKIDLLPLGSHINWADHATVRLRDSHVNCNNGQQTQARCSLPGIKDAIQCKPPPFASLGNTSVAAATTTRIDDDGYNGQDLNRQLEVFLKGFSADDFDKVDEAKQSRENEIAAAATCGGSDWAKDLEDGFESPKAGSENEIECKPSPIDLGEAVDNAFDEDLNKQLEAHLNGLSEDEFEQADEAKQSCDDQLNSAVGHVNVTQCIDVSKSVAYRSNQDDAAINYLAVDSAEILCPESNRTNTCCYHDTPTETREKLHRMYNLALLLYELFSGGETPTPELYALATFDEAFISLPTLTLTKTSNHDKNSSSEPKRRQCPSGNKTGLSMCKLSFEYLKFIGTPGPICHLIFNMLDCVYGDLSGNDCYTNIREVKSDLKLMLDRPFKFLRDSYTDNLSSSGLQFNEITIPREKELESIQLSYRRCMSGSREFSIIRGESGSGKSWLAQCVARFVIEEGGVFLMGKFDQMQQTKPFSSFASAFNQYCELLISQKESDWAKSIVKALRNGLGRDGYHLIQVIPKLGQVLDSFGNNSSVFNNDWGNAMQRILYLLCQFVAIISTNSFVPVTLFLDDVQWIDEASILVLNRILSQKCKNFFFLGCVRDDEIGDDHSFWKMVESARADGICTTIVEMKCMDEDSLLTALSDLLCLSPRLVRSLSAIIYSRTKGNPLFIIQLLISLNRDSLLRIDLGSKRWVWDEEKICAAQIPDNVARCFTNGISKLEVDVQLALHTLSMFGASITSECIKCLEDQLNVKIKEPLDVAVAKGLVSNVQGSYQFSHDRIQETCYQMIPEQDRLCNHMTYGRCLVKRSLEIGDDDLLFTSIHQINLGGPPAIVDREEYFIMASHNLNAAKKAISRSDFHLAFIFLDNGISFLRKKHWIDHYDFSLEIFDLAAKCALVTGNISSLNILSNQILRHTRCFEDKLNVHFVLMSSLLNSWEVSAALEKGLVILNRLGEDIPSNPSSQAVQQQMQQTVALITGTSADHILNYRVMTDTKKLAAMRFMAKLQNIAFFVNHLLHSFLIMRLVQMTISHGLSPMSPVGFACFGSYLAKHSKIQLGSWFATLAKSLKVKLGANDAAGEVILLVAEVQCYVQPMLAPNEMHSEGESASLSAGDIHFACFNRLLHSLNLYWSGSDLAVVTKKISEACSFIKSLGHEGCLMFMMLMQSTALTVQGSESESNRNDFIRSVQENENPRTLFTLSFHRLYLSFLFNKSDVKECCERFFSCVPESGCVLYSESIHVFISGLASFRIFRETQEPNWLSRGKTSMEETRVWAEEGSLWNFQQKLILLEAEQNFCHGNFSAAKQCYKKAIECAKSHKYLNDEALACELAGIFYLNTGDVTSSLQHFLLAHEKYQKWGATGKATALFSYVNGKFASLLGPPCSLQGM